MTSYRGLSARHGALFLDFGNDPALSGDTTYFRDPEHLNQHGAEKFSQELGDSLAIDWRRGASSAACSGSEFAGVCRCTWLHSRKDRSTLFNRAQPRRERPILRLEQEVATPSMLNSFGGNDLRTLLEKPRIVFHLLTPSEHFRRVRAH